MSRRREDTIYEVLLTLQEKILSLESTMNHQQEKIQNLEAASNNDAQPRNNISKAFRASVIT